MHPSLLHEIARQRKEDLRRAARQHGPAGPRSRRLVAAARTIRPGGGPPRSIRRPQSPVLRQNALVWPTSERNRDRWNARGLRRRAGAGA